MTIAELYEWAKERGFENRNLITTHSYDFLEVGELMIETIAGQKQYVELERISEINDERENNKTDTGLVSES